MILQYQADSRAIGYKSKVPRTLEMRLETAWRNYDAVRRQVEWFIAQNVEYAAAPEKFLKARPPPLPLAPMTLPTPSPSVPPHLQGSTPKAAAAASPIQLGAASLLSNQPAATNAPGGFPDGLLESGLDLSGMGMDELNAIIGGAQNANGGNDMGMPPQLPGPIANPTANVDNQPDQNAMTPNTSNLLNTLQGTTTGGTNDVQGESQTQQQGQPSGEFDFNFGENGDVDLSNIDLSAFDELFGDDPSGSGAIGSVPDTAAVQPPEEKKEEQPQPASVPPETESSAPVAEQSQTLPAEQPSQPQQTQSSPQKQTSPAQQPMSQPPSEPIAGNASTEAAHESTASQPAPASEPAPPPAAESVPIPAPEPEPQLQDPNNGLGDFDLGNDLGGDMGDINFDDFNFGEMPNVDGSEFASLFAEFK